MSNIYEIRISLFDSDPEIWRTVLVPGDFTLGTLHSVIQFAMGWENCHLHEFFRNDIKYTDPEFITELYEDEVEPENEYEYTIETLFKKEKDFLMYIYDYGDGWMHDIKVIGIKENDERYKGVPVCIDGQNACPPEDVGGIGGYYHFLEVLSDPEHEEYEDFRNWINGIFSPLKFNIEEANKYLAKVQNIYSNATDVMQRIVGMR
jgi:hypothetical protein